MISRTTKSPTSPEITRRRWLLGLEPRFEGGWLHKGKRARAWDVEDSLSAISLVGDVTIDLTTPKSLSAEVAINAFAILRDVDVLVSQGTHVELSGRANSDHLNNLVPAVPIDYAAWNISVAGAGVFGGIKSPWTLEALLRLTRGS